MKPFSVYSDIKGLFTSEHLVNEMVTLLHNVFHNYCAPSLPKMLKRDSFSTLSTSIFVNTSNLQNNKILEHSDFDIEVEDVCLVEDKDDIVQPTKLPKTSLPITRSKT